MALVTSFTEPVVLTAGLPSTPAAPGSYFGFGLNATKSASTGPRIYTGTGTPNGTTTAPAGSLWIQSDSTLGAVYINTTGSTVWTVLALGGSGGVSAVIPDPGTGVAIPVTNSGILNLTVGAGAETNTLAAPGFSGQVLIINENVAGAGTRAITASAAVNIAGNTVMTFNAARDSIGLVGVQVASALVWQIMWNNNVALS